VLTLNKRKAERKRTWTCKADCRAVPGVSPTFVTSVSTLLRAAKIVVCAGSNVSSLMCCCVDDDETRRYKRNWIIIHAASVLMGTTYTITLSSQYQFVTNPRHLEDPNVCLLTQSIEAVWHC